MAGGIRGSPDRWEVGRWGDLPSLHWRQEGDQGSSLTSPALATGVQPLWGLWGNPVLKIPIPGAPKETKTMEQSLGAWWWPGGPWRE